MPQHIGIVACSAEGAALCYRTICAEGAHRAGPHAHPEVSIHSHSLADYVDCLDREDLPGIAKLMLSSARKLAAIGADFLICPDNTVHQAFSEVEALSPRPWLHIAEVVAAEAVRRGHARLGLAGTRWLVESEVYPAKLAAHKLECMLPTATERAGIHRIIMDELVRGVFKPEAITYFQRVFRRMQHEGCDAVILGCTEIPLVMNDANSPLPTLDSTRLLARAALDRAARNEGNDGHALASWRQAQTDLKRRESRGLMRAAISSADAVPQTPAAPADIDAYIAGFAAPVQALLHSVRQAVRRAAPAATERISYRIPTFALHGNLIHFAAFKSHIGLYPGARAIEVFKADLQGLRTAKGTVQFALDKPLALALIERIVAFRVEENLERARGRRAG